MANENFFPGQIPGKPIGTGEGESPLAKPTVPNTDIRTMASDVQSVSTGAPTPKPYAPQAAAPENLPTAPVSSQSFQIPQTDSVPLPTDQQPTPKKGKGGLFVVLISIIVVIGLAALGYFVIYPIFFADSPEITNNEVSAPENNLPPVEEEVLPTIPEEVVTPPITEPEPQPTIPAHISLFPIPTDAIIEAASAVTGGALSGLDITSPSPSITEVVYKDTDGNFVKFADILKTTTGADLSGTALETVFDDQSAAGLVYTDANGVRWLGLIASLKTAENTSDNVLLFKTIFEQSVGYNSLFAGEPGAQKTWRDSAVTGMTDHRFLLFANPGFSVDYGWVNNKVIIMTSFDGLKEAVRRI